MGERNREERETMVNLGGRGGGAGGVYNEKDREVTTCIPLPLPEPAPTKKAVFM